jgi:RNA polymerase sigma-70 factor (ECF subfamily)
MLGNHADAEDVVQDTLLQVVRRLGTFRGEAALTTWLHRVTVNAALVYRRKAAHRRERPVRAALGCLARGGTPGRPAAGGPDGQALSREARHLIERAIGGLPPAYQEVYVLADVEGLPNAEVGAVLGLRLPAVKSRLHRARRLLRRALAPYFGGACGH